MIFAASSADVMKFFSKFARAISGSWPRKRSISAVMRLERAMFVLMPPGRTPVVGDDAVGPGVDRAPVGDVERRRRRFDTERAHHLRRLVGRLGVDVGERDLRAGSRELEGERASDAGSGAGDRGDLAFEGL